MKYVPKQIVLTLTPYKMYFENKKVKRVQKRPSLIQSRHYRQDVLQGRSNSAPGLPAGKN